VILPSQLFIGGVVKTATKWSGHKFKTATIQNGDVKTATKWPGENGDNPKRLKVKAATRIYLE